MVSSKRCGKKNISELRFGVIHSQVGFSDGVSIVIEQIESVLKDNLGVSEKNILYLVGKARVKGSRIFEDEILWDRHKVNRRMISRFESGFGGALSEKIEGAILEAKGVIGKFVREKRIDVLIVHNSSHPVNFVSSIALSRFYRDSTRKKRKTPKYVLWWHDSHLERDHFSNPANDVEKYLLEGVPGRFVEHVVFINRLQLAVAKKYFLKIDKRYPGFYKRMLRNYCVAYNTTNTFVDSFKDLFRKKNGVRVEKFLKDFGARKFLSKKGIGLKETLFCLQHTRVVDRKRIDFALKYCYELLEHKDSKMFKAVYFLVSGQSYSDGSRGKLERLNKKLSKRYKGKIFFVFAEDYRCKSEISFMEFPKIFARLGGFSTYFSEVEGFGNNLLEVLASGLIPVVYRYPVFRKDIEPFGFGLVGLDEFKVREEDLRDTLKIVKSKRIRGRMANGNLEILREHFPHSVIGVKLMQAIAKKRAHK